MPDLENSQGKSCFVGEETLMLGRVTPKKYFVSPSAFSFFSLKKIVLVTKTPNCVAALKRFKFN